MCGGGGEGEIGVGKGIRGIRVWWEREGEVVIIFCLKMKIKRDRYIFREERIDAYL